MGGPNPPFSGDRDQLLTLPHDKEIDLAITGRPLKVIATHGHPFGAHPVVMACAPDHPLLGTRGPKAPAASHQLFIAREQERGRGRRWRTVSPRIASCRAS